MRRPDQTPWEWRAILLCNVVWFVGIVGYLIGVAYGLTYCLDNYGWFGLYLPPVIIAVVAIPFLAKFLLNYYVFEPFIRAVQRWDNKIRR